ncbi:MAG: SGNH/GDSL hydrolase family protein [Planctomycetota bacterium]|jgi:lysophospholipase L1-like esterase
MSAVALKQRLMLVLIVVGVMLLDCFSADTVANEPVKIMPLGDSITYGYGYPIKNGYRKPLYLSLVNGGYNIDFVGSLTNGDFPDPSHEGHSGWHAAQDGTTNDILDRVHDWLTSNPADIVLLHIGTNDITDANQDPNEVSDILDEIDRYSEDITVILALIINRATYNPETTQYNNELNSMALGRITAGDDIIIVDMESALNYPTDMSDNLHPNTAGYAKMADVWYDALKTLLGAGPKITSTPLTEAIVQQLYTYDVNTTDAPNEPNYTLTTYPNDMTIDINGLIEWIPAAVGDYNVIVMASNGAPPDANQSFTISVVPIIEFDAAGFASDSIEDNYFSFSHTIGSGCDRLLVVALASEDNSADDLVINSVTYDGIDMNSVVDSNQSIYSSNMYMNTELYYLLDKNLPSPGSHDVAVTYKGNIIAKCGGTISLENVAQKAAEVVDTNSNTDANSISTNIITLTDGAWIVDVVGSGNQGSFSVNAPNMIERFDVNGDSSSVAGGTKLVGFSGQTAVSWIFDSSANRLAHSVAAFPPVETLNRAVSGYINDPNDKPVEGVLILADNEGGSYTSEPNGYYRIPVPYGWSGKVTPIKAEHLFSPPERQYSNVMHHQTSQDYEEISIYDLYEDGFIDAWDLEVITNNWLAQNPDNPCNFNGDNIVDFEDYAMFAVHWHE